MPIERGAPDNNYNRWNNWSWRTAASDVGRRVVTGAAGPLASAAINAIDRRTGGTIQNTADRVFRAGADRNTQLENNYMRDMFQQDSTAMRPSLMDRIRGAFSGTPTSPRSDYDDYMRDMMRDDPGAGGQATRDSAPLPRATQAFRPSQFQRNQAARQAPRERTEEEAAADRRAALDNSSAYGTARFLETMRFAPRGHVE